MGRREVKKQQKRDRMLREGLRLFGEHGFERASVEQIVSASDVARGTFYLYFEDKLALFQALTNQWFEVVLGILDDVRKQIAGCDTPDQVWQVYQDMGAGLAWVGLANRDEILMAFRESRGRTPAGAFLRQRELELLEVAVVFTEDAAARGLVRVEDPRLTCLVILGAAERLLYEVLLGEDVGDPTEMARQVVGLFERAMQRGADPAAQGLE